MTNIRTSGFDSPAQMREYLEEVDDSLTARSIARENLDMERAIRELRGEIGELRRRLEEMQRQEEQAGNRASGWLRVAATMTLTVVLGRIAKHQRLGVLGAVAAPIMVAQLNRKF